MVIEWLKVWVSQTAREAFIQKDEAIWSRALARCPGYLGKMVWINPKDPEELVLVIQWADRESWSAVPQDYLEETERLFAEAMAGESYKIVEAAEYQVRKFNNL
jgi:uncharacterized protein (TIGR03792 family)